MFIYVCAWLCVSLLETHDPPLPFADVEDCVLMPLKLLTLSRGLRLSKLLAELFERLDP